MSLKYPAVHSRSRLPQLTFSQFRLRTNDLTSLYKNRYLSIWRLIC